jgi:aerobic carbon-monoxide dehydrogenase medium subunit
VKNLKQFEYFEPSTLPEAIRILSEQGSRAYPLAGGTDILVRMKRGEIMASALVNLKRIEGLNQIKKGSEKGISIGALVSISEIEDSPLLRSACPVLAESASVLGSPSIRNLASLGGNVGRASPASDMIPSLIVLKANVLVEGPKGKKEVEVEKFFSGPGKTILSSGEVITSIFVPGMAENAGAAYLKLGRTAGIDCCLVGAAASLTLSGKGNEAKEARIALSAVAPVPLRGKRTEEVLLSGTLSEGRINEAARVAVEESSPITDFRGSAYRQEMVRVLTYRAISRALEQAHRGGKT